MRIGDASYSWKDTVIGRNIIYDDLGNLILQPNEKMLATEKKVKCSLISKWKSWGIITEIIEDAGLGTFYRTDRRLVYIRNPQPLKTSWVTRAALAADMKKRGLKEWFEIPLVEVVGYSTHGILRSYLQVYVLSEEKRYKLMLSTRKQKFLLTALRNKRKVKNATELEAYHE